MNARRFFAVFVSILMIVVAQPLAMAPPEPVTEDQHGDPRPMDGDNDGTEYCDIGSYEALHPYNQGFQDGLKECSKVVGGAVKPVDLSELGATYDDVRSTHIPMVLWIGLASALVIGGDIFILRRRRAR